MTRWLMTFAVGVAAAVTSLTGQTQTGAAGRPPARQNTPLMMMSPKAKSAGWTGIHEPHTKIADVLARHKAEADWAETVVDDESLNAQWISLGPGNKTPRRMNGDTREWWIVRSGTLRFTIDGSEPIVAAKGVMVQVPYRTLYQIENIGTEPEQIVGYLNKLKGFPGVYGDISFTPDQHNGYPDDEVVMVEANSLKDGAFNLAPGYGA